MFEFLLSRVEWLFIAALPVPTRLLDGRGKPLAGLTRQHQETGLWCLDSGTQCPGKHKVRHNMEIPSLWS